MPPTAAATGKKAARRLARSAVDEFSLDLQADDEEEDRDETFVDTLSKHEVHRVAVDAE